MIDRHDAVTQALRKLATRAAIKCTYTPKGCFSSPSINNETGEVKTYYGLTPDLRLFLAGHVVTGKDDNRHVVVDVRITDSTCPSQIGIGIEKSEDDKVRKYGDASDANGLIFVPLVMEVLGKWSEQTTAFVKGLVKTILMNEPEGMPECVILTYWRKRISSVLQRYNAAMLMGRYSRSTTRSNSKDSMCDESNDFAIVSTYNA